MTMTKGLTKGLLSIRALKRLMNKLEHKNERTKDIVQLLLEDLDKFGMSKADIVKLKICWKTDGIPPADILERALFTVYNEMENQVFEEKMKRENEYKDAKQFKKKLDMFEGKSFQQVVEDAHMWNKLGITQKKLRELEQKESHRKRLLSWKIKKELEKERKKKQKRKGENDE